MQNLIGWLQLGGTNFILGNIDLKNKIHDSPRYG